MVIRTRDRTPAPGRSNVRVYEDRWGVSTRVVQLRPHLWRHLRPRLQGGRILEIGPGLRPTAPADGSYFVESSPQAAAGLARAGGRAAQVGGWRLPFRAEAFAGVLALEVLEHVEEDVRLLGEIVRVLRPKGTAVISVPLHMSLWSAIDDACAHVRRYAPEELLEKIRAAGLEPLGYGTRRAQARPVLARAGTSVMSTFPRLSNWWLQHAVFPLASAFDRTRRVRWAELERPVPARAGGMTVLATKPGG